MPDSVTVMTRQSWGRRLRGSFNGILVGLVMVVASMWLLLANEGRAVQRYKALQQGAREVVSIGADRVDPATEGKLVHLSGKATAAGTLRDPQLGVAARAIHLKRQVEMYQWLESTQTETKKKVGGSTETTTTYSYNTGWSGRPVESSSFQEPSGHRNPTSMPYSSRTVSADRVTLGAFDLSPGLIERIDRWAKLEVSSTAGLPEDLRRSARVHEGGFYIGRNPSVPRVGDLRISFRVVQPTMVSVVSRQAGHTFAPYQTRSGSSVELLRIGLASAEEMFAAARRANKVLTWFLRLAGSLMMMLGFLIVLRPLSVLADVLPILGNLVEKGSAVLAFALALPIALTTIAIAWLAQRPLLGIAILALALLALVFLVRKVQQARRAAAVAHKPGTYAPSEPSPAAPSLPPLPSIPPPPPPPD